jgi:phage/plasmid-associated DNA primase
MWRRILQLPFVNVIPKGERDERVKLALRSDPDVRAAILAWAAQGCLEWQQRGLDVPDVVRDYTAAYRAEQDPLRDWLADCTETDPAAWTSAADLRTSYEQWCEANGERPVTTKKLGTLLDPKGYTAEKSLSGNTRGRKGIRAR